MNKPGVLENTKDTDRWFSYYFQFIGNGSNASQHHPKGLQAAPVFVIQHECVGSDAVLEGRLFCLHGAVLRDAALFKKDFYFAFFPAVS